MKLEAKEAEKQAELAKDIKFAVSPRTKVKKADLYKKREESKFLNNLKPVKE